MRALLILFAVLYLLAVTAVSAAESDDPELTALPDRPPAPDFDLAGPDGDRFRLADYRGMPLIVNFWATWCPPCRAEMPSMQRAWEEVKDEGIAMIAINAGEDANTIRQFTADYPVEFPLPMDRDFKVIQSWPLKGLPTTFVVDPEGRLAYRAAGEREWDDPKLLDLVRELKIER
ncbi:MAG: redoxin domain-containing protein [Pseudomonadota bacterium]|nr:redoxin domain-containing protein [Pseudomonadota bacterium]